jgi:membrane-anchored protein YejM (alkaline phosphatase superfamily)
VSWVRTLPKLNATQEAYIDEFYRGRLRTLQAVDEMVEVVVETLAAAGKLDNTYIFYTCESWLLFFG